MKRPAFLLLVALPLIVCAAIRWREISIERQYTLGMSIAEVRSLTGGRFATHKFGIEYRAEPTQQQMNDDAIYYIYDESAGVMLLFNHREKLIEKKRVKWCGINFYKLVDCFRKHG